MSKNALEMMNNIDDDMIFSAMETPKKKGPNGEAMPDMASSMNKTMPIMTAVFCFMLPAGIGVYWIVSNIMQMITQVCLNLWFAKRKEQEA